MKNFLVTIIFIFLFVVLSTNLFNNDRPLIGVQNRIEPGKTEAEIDLWFKILADHHMPVTRFL